MCLSEIVVKRLSVEMNKYIDYFTENALMGFYTRWFILSIRNVSHVAGEQSFHDLSLVKDTKRNRVYSYLNIVAFLARAKY